ncbi:ABC transporter substrate-binding protein [Butyrivibrio sp. INlla14]|uniref:ABC transporter substrate-binding protein n=1 Tax=Butyrivibrio sp. INlla14 TaxID=1520808 RepID=UPI00087612A6|nr:ABC transporter substrate-binding protein [Butyrivibrio sp. INlla14]SCX98663.1 peptide/nickel transport system substrate-binding protein [Butyrivibrio sp. INlla14]
MRRKMNSKAVSLVLAAATGMTMLAGCGGAATPAQTSGDTSATTEATAVEAQTGDIASNTEEVTVEGFAEAPMLADQVAAGNLPAVEERIPDADNVFVETVDATGAPLEIGSYGGVINLGPAGGSWGLSRPSLESIIRYNTDGSYYPNVIKSFEHTDDYTTWTFHLREGMKWSDGEPFTADDITFWYYMCHLTNYDSKKSWAALKEEVDGEDAWADLKKVDDYTVTWTFVNPKYPADFIENGDFKWCWAPAHYLMDLIPDSEDYPYVENEYYQSTGLSEEEVLANAQKKNIDAATVKDLGKSVSYNFWNVAGIPTVNSFVLSTVPGNSSKDDTLCIMDRNPYFWKVDAAGNQLPYVDALHFNQTSEDGQDLLMFRSGEIDIIAVAMKDIAATLSDLGDTASLREWGTTNWGSYQVTFNYTNPDKNYADLFANPDFREAISICVDRNQASELLTDGFLEPGQCGPMEGNVGYSQEWVEKWTEYDVDKAKSLLEGCGLKMGSDGFYTFADGSELMLTFLEYDGGMDDAYPVFEQYYKAVGLNCAIKNLEVSAFDEAIDNNEWVAVMGPHTAVGGASLKDRAAPFVPIAQAAEWYGEYGTYYATKGAQGVEPTGDMAKLVELYDKWRLTADETERDSYQAEIYKIHQDNLWTIAYLKAEGYYELINSSIKNYADNLVSADCYQYANMTHYEVLFKAE